MSSKTASSPVPVPRNVRSASNVGKSHTEMGPVTSGSAVEIDCVKMNKEIVQYRTNIRERSLASFDQNAAAAPKGNNVDNNLESLKRELQDVKDKNSQWQVYNDQREEYVKNLLEKYNDLHLRFHDMHQSYTQLTNNPGKLSDEQRRYFDGLLVQARQELGASREENSKLKTELENLGSKVVGDLKKLQEDADHWKAMYEQETEVSSRLREQREKYITRRKNNAEKENWDLVASLQKEMESYREDFRSERHKREKLEHRLDQLHRKVRDSESSRKLIGHDTKQTDLAQSKHHSTNGTRSIVTPPKMQKISARFEKQSQPPRERRSHPVEPMHITTRSRKERAHKHQEERYKIPSPNDKMNKTYSEFGHSDGLTLQCPNCGKTYGFEEHEFLLIHIDSCI